MPYGTCRGILAIWLGYGWRAARLAMWCEGFLYGSSCRMSVVSYARGVVRQERVGSPHGCANRITAWVVGTLQVSFSLAQSFADSDVLR